MSAADLTQKILRATDALRGRMETWAYTDLISAMLLLKWASDRPDLLEVPEQSRWSTILKSEVPAPNEALQRALIALAHSNPEILGSTFENVDFTKRLTRSDARKLVHSFDTISLKPEDLKFEDVVGHAYDQVLEEFADIAGKRGGEFQTPRSVVRLMVRLSAPEPTQSVYDPVAGVGGTLIQAAEYAAERTGQRGTLDLFGQEMNATTCGIARLNLLFHGETRASLRCGNSLTNPLHTTDDGRLRTFDRVFANPPFSMNYERTEIRFPERMQYGWSRKADLMFVQHVLATLRPDGIGVVITPHGVLFRSGSEAEIRRNMILDNRVAAVIGIGANAFHGTSLPACILVLRGTQEARTQSCEVFFINAEHEIATGRSRNYLHPRHIEKIVTTFRHRRTIPHFSRAVPVDEIASHDFTLNIRRYVEPALVTEPPMDVHGVIFGGVPRREVETRLERFHAFGIDLTTLLTPRGADYFDFPTKDHGVIAEVIREKARAVESRFLGHLHDWFSQEKPTLLRAESDALPSARDELMKSFRAELLKHAILDEHQLVGVFADWWEVHRDELRELSPTNLQPGAGNVHAVDAGPRTTVLGSLEDDLSARVKKLFAQELQKLIDSYQSWSERYGTSLVDLERELETSSAALRSRLRNLGHPWPDLI